MSANKPLKNLFKSYSSGNKEEFLKAAEEIIENEELKNNRLLAEELRNSLYNKKSKNDSKITIKTPTDKEKGTPLFEIFSHNKTWSDLILNDETKGDLERILKENAEKQVLNSYGLKPANKLLFFGPPGCGKTLAAQVISGMLMYPLIYVRFDAVISSYLGETSANLRKIFDFIEQGEWVILFDEFDIIGKYRDNNFEQGEIQRLVNNLLQMIDNYKGDSIIIAATNHQQLLDPALWRRFDKVVFFGLPGDVERLALFKKNLSFIKTKSIDYDILVQKSDDMTPADIEAICINAIKDMVLNNKKSLDTVTIEESLDNHLNRLHKIQKYS